jgi:hypothetical protein
LIIPVVERRHDKRYHRANSGIALPIEFEDNVAYWRGKPSIYYSEPFTPSAT